MKSFHLTATWELKEDSWWRKLLLRLGIIKPSIMDNVVKHLANQIKEEIDRQGLEMIMKEVKK